MVMKVQPRVDAVDVERIQAQPRVVPETATQTIKPEEKKTSLEIIVDQVEVEAAVDSINGGAIEHVHRGLRFVVHEDTNRMMVRVVDVLTDEVIKEIPPRRRSWIPRPEFAR